VKVRAVAGMRSGALLVLSVPTGRGSIACACDCGRLVSLRRSVFERRRRHSCGCRFGLRYEKHGASRGARVPSGYRVWQQMRERCGNPEDPAFPRYGGAGIRVCRRWEVSFADFMADVGPRPTPKHTIDRYPNGAGGYEPGNVRWATYGEQRRNQARVRFFELDGESLCLTDWSARYGKPAQTVAYRLEVLGWSLREALTRPTHEVRRLQCNRRDGAGRFVGKAVSP